VLAQDEEKKEKEKQNGGDEETQEDVCVRSLCPRRNFQLGC